MNNSKTLSALNYFSVFFAPFLVPIIVYFVSPDSEVKRHSIRALLSHIIPLILGILFMAVLVIIDLYNLQVDENGLFITTLIAILGYVLLYLTIVIWNVVQGIKVLR